MIDALGIILFLVPMGIVMWLIVAFLVHALFFNDGPFAPLVARFRRNKENSN